MAGWYHCLDERESEWTPGNGDGQGGLACCDSWGCTESDVTERLNWTELNWTELNWICLDSHCLDLTFQVPMQYCSLQHRTLLPSPVTSTTGGCFRFDSISSFFLELFLHWSPVAYLHTGHLPTWGVHLSVSYIFAFSYCSLGFQGSEVFCHSLLQWTTFCHNSPPWHLRWPYTAWLIVSSS